MKKRLLIFVSFMLTMTILITNTNYVYAEENSDPLFSFTANKNQLELMDALAEENPGISHGEILQKTVPNLWKQLPDTVKRTLYNSRFKGNADDTEDLIANAETSGYEFISTSSWVDYINPYE